MCALNYQDVHCLPLPGDLPETFCKLHAAGRGFRRWLHRSYNIAHCMLSKVRVTGEWRTGEDSEGDESIWATIRAFAMRAWRIGVRMLVSQLDIEPITSEKSSLELSLYGYKATTLLTCTRACPVLILFGAPTILTKKFVAFLPQSNQMME
jgi:hypothetical protein